MGYLHVSTMCRQKLNFIGTDEMKRHQAFVYSDTSAYLHWWCAQDNPGNTIGSDAILVRLDGDNFEVSRRLWAFAGYFRFARPGSVRIDALSPAENLKVTAFENTNGTLAIPVINEAHFERQVEVSLKSCKFALSFATAYLADNKHNNTIVGMYKINGAVLLANVPPRSLTTFFLE